MKKWQGAVDDVTPFSAIFITVLRLLTHGISNLALQAMEKVPDVSRNSARCSKVVLIVLQVQFISVWMKTNGFSLYGMNFAGMPCE